MSIKVNRKPFLLRPDKPPEGEPRRMFEGETETELTPQMQERARGAGVVVRRPSWSPNTLLVHQVTAFAIEEGLDNEFHHSAAKAYWEDGADLADIGVLKEIGEGCGMDWAKLSPLLETGQYRETVLQLYEEAKDLGVGGTPAYMVGGELIAGDVSLEDLRAAVQKASST